MANGHIEVHALPPKKTNDDDLSSHTDCKSTLDIDAVMSTEEFSVMKAYAQRRRLLKKSVESSKPGSPDTLNGGSDSNGTSSPQTPPKTEQEAPEEEKKGGKKKRFKLSKFLRCIKPQTKDDEPEESPKTPNDQNNRCGVLTRGEVEDKFDEIAIRLTEIADDIPFTPPELESDAPDDEVEKLIGLLLRETGDKLNERELKNVSIAAELFGDYNFFERLITTLLRRMGLGASDPDTPGPQTSPKTQIAVTCEVTSRLSALDTLPMNRLLGHGATYLQNHFSSWARQNGGYEAAFDGDEEEEVQ